MFRHFGADWRAEHAEQLSRDHLRVMGPSKLVGPPLAAALRRCAATAARSASPTTRAATAIVRIRHATSTLSLTAAGGQIGVERQRRVSFDAKCQPSYQP